MLIVLSLALVGPAVWNDYLRHADDLRRMAIEDGAGVWHRTISLFVFARRLGADVPMAYAMQAAVALAAAAIVARAWLRDVPAPTRYALLVLGTFLATPYLQDYDMVVGAFVVVWLMASSEAAPHLRRPALIACALILIVPLFAAMLANTTGPRARSAVPDPRFLLAARVAFDERLWRTRRAAASPRS